MATKQFTHTLVSKVVFFVSLLVYLWGFSFAGAAWQLPEATPPNGNASVPLNTFAVDQVKNAGLSVGDIMVTGGDDIYVEDSLRIATSGNAVHPIEMGGTPGGTNGIRFPDGTVQFSANPTPVPLEIKTDGALNNGGATQANLGADWEYVLIHGTIMDGDAGSSGGFIYKENGVAKAAFNGQTGYHAEFTLSTSVQCLSIDGTMCAWLDATTGELWYRSTGEFRTVYVVLGLQ